MSLYLADACALIDFYTADPVFPAALRSLITDGTSTIAVASTTVWEIAIKTRHGKLVDIVDPKYPTLGDMITAHGYVPLPLDHDTLEQAAGLPPLHADPFDRALVAPAQRTGRTILTSDRIIPRYGVPVWW